MHKYELLRLRAEEFRTVLEEYAEKGCAWLSGNMPQIELEYSLPENVGIAVSKGATSAVDSASLRLILRRDNSMPNGYRVHTGFPTK